MENRQNKPKISIIVPVYKVEEYLRRCIDSILNQIFKDFEVILVDDGSPDKCGEICDSYKLDKRVKVIHKENGGLSSARNAGLDIAEGDYIGFVDSDDFIHPQMYKILYESIIRNESDICVCNYNTFKNDNDIDKFDIKCNIYENNYTNIECLQCFYNKENVNFILAWNKLYKSNLFNTIRYPLGVIYEDAYIAHRILYKCKKVTHISSILYYYNIGNNSITRSNFSIKNLDNIYFHDDRMKFFRKIGNYQLKINSEYVFVQAVFSQYFRAKNELRIRKKELFKFKLIFIKNIGQMIRNPLFNYKEKLLWIVFCISDKWYERYIKSKEVSQSGTNNINNQQSI